MNKKKFAFTSFVNKRQNKEKLRYEPRRPTKNENQSLIANIKRSTTPEKIYVI